MMGCVEHGRLQSEEHRRIVAHGLIGNLTCLFHLATEASQHLIIQLRGQCITAQIGQRCTLSHPTSVVIMYLYEPRPSFSIYAARCPCRLLEMEHPFLNINLHGFVFIITA